jgi:hypothetical protein
MYQTEKFRGGGTGGLENNEATGDSVSLKTEMVFGEIKVKPSATGRNSIFKVVVRASDFFSDFLAAAMALHKGQRCFPSKVSETASETDCVRKFVASIVAQATVCRAVQCNPVVKTSKTTTKIFPQRADTLAVYSRKVRRQARKTPGFIQLECRALFGSMVRIMK